MPAPDPSESRSLESLVSCAVQEATRTEEDDAAYWASIEALRKMGPHSCWSVVAPLAKDPRPEVRALVPDVLRYFDPHPLQEETVTLLAKMLELEDSALVLRSIASAFVDLRHDRAADLLPPLLEHEDANLRFSVVHGLLPVAGPRTLESFIRASTDEDEDVRNWATFGLRTILNEPTEPGAFDSSQLREALAARVNDSCSEIRAEAILALATRQDIRALEPLKRELRDWPEWNHCIEAAQWFGLPELVPFLKALLQAYPEEEASLSPAIQACTPKP